MSKSRLRQIVRQFPENGLKLLLETPANVRELLQLTGTELIELIDFDRLTRSSATFVARDFRHVEADVVLRAPVVARRRRGSATRSVVVYILIEHQSEPEPLMILRLLEYLVQIYKRQARQSRGKAIRRPPLDPVLPVVLYTGTAAWDSLGSMSELVALGELFKELIPCYRPLFLNVGALAPQAVESRGGGFGPVLRLLQQRKARPAEFQALLARTVERLEALVDAEQARWRDLLTYIHALVYNQRRPVEQPRLQRTIIESVHTERSRRESGQMAKTIAEALKEEGRREGERKGERKGELYARQQTLLRQLRRRFGDVPPDVAETIQATKDLERLDDWLDRILTATTLDKMQIA